MDEKQIKYVSFNLESMKEDKVFKWLKLGLEVRASDKTTRYFIDASNDRFVTELANVVFTIKTMMHLAYHEKKVLVEGEYYRLTDYELPVNICALVKCGVVWTTKEAAYFSEPYYLADAPVSTELKLWSPQKVASFFRRYNANQAVDAIEMANVQLDIVCLTDLKGLAAKTEGHHIRWDEGIGSIDAKVAICNGIQTLWDDAMVVRYANSNDEVMGAWLTGKN